MSIEDKLSARLDKLTREIEQNIELKLLAKYRQFEKTSTTKLDSSLSRIITRLDKLEQQVTEIDAHKRDGPIQPISKKRKLGTDGPEVEAQVRSMREFADNTVSKVAEVEGRLDVLEVRATSIEDSNTTFNAITDKFTYNDQLVTKHQKAMVQMRDYLTQHQDFIDGLCKTLGITANCGEEPDEQMADFPIKVIHELRSRIDNQVLWNEQTLMATKEVADTVAQSQKDIVEIKFNLKRACEAGADWSRFRPSVAGMVKMFVTQKGTSHEHASAQTVTQNLKQGFHVQQPQNQSSTGIRQQQLQSQTHYQNQNHNHNNQVQLLLQQDQVRYPAQQQQQQQQQERLQSQLPVLGSSAAMPFDLADPPQGFTPTDPFQRQ